MSIKRAWKALVPPLTSAGLLGLVAWWVDFGDVLQALERVDPLPLLAAFLLLILNIFVVSARLQSLLKMLGQHVGFHLALRACVAGQVASLWIINLIGNTVGRQFVLRQARVDVAAVALATGYERLVLIAMSAAMCAIGFVIVFGFDPLRDAMGDLPLIGMAVSFILAAGLLYLWARRSEEVWLVLQALRWQLLWRLFKVAGFTLVAQTLFLLVYFSIGAAYLVDIPALDFLAVAAVLSFVASLPITVNGWGLREVASIYLLGHFGVSAHDAVLISVTVGAASTAVIALSSGLVAFGEVRAARPAEGVSHLPIQGAQMGAAAGSQSLRLFAVLAGMGAAMFLFYQVQIQIAGTPLSVNLADPIALVSAAFLCAAAIVQRQLPVGLSKPVILWLGAVSVLLCFGFLRGTVDFGVTGWALGNRLIGWVVVLGYVGCGGMIVTVMGQRGRRILARGMAVVAVAVVLTSIAIQSYYFSGHPSPRNLSSFSGFSSNRNTFVFQLMITFAVLFPVLLAARRRGAQTFLIVICGLLLLGILQTGSKLGLLTVTALLLCIAVSNRNLLKPMFLCFLVAAASAVLVWALPHALHQIQVVLFPGVAEDIYGSRTILRGLETLEQSALDERLVSIQAGLGLWLANPVFGSGLGSAIRLNLGLGGQPLVIHSTPIWILAEFGVVGLAVVLSLPVWLLLKHWKALWAYVRNRAMPQYYLSVLGVCLVFAVFGLGHEIAYQRIFWLMFGALAAHVLRGERSARAIVAESAP